MFSSTTTEASTFMPAESAKPPREIRFRFIPTSFIMMNAMRRLSGISIAAVTTFRKLPMKMNSTTTARKAAIATSRSTPSTLLSMNSAGFTSTLY